MEQQNFEIRKNVLKYDEVLNKQRTVIYGERRTRARRRRPVRPDPADDRRRGRAATSRAPPPSGYAEEWDLDQLWTALKTLTRSSLTVEDAIEQAGGEKADLTREFLVEELIADAEAAYDAREEELGAEVLRELERRVLLSVLDRKWREHLYEMDYLQEGIGLRAMAQRDPLVEYQREGFDMFAAMMEAIKEESVGFLFNLEVQVERRRRRARAGRPAGRRVDRSRPARRGVLARAQDEHDRNGDGRAPHVTAKGLERTTSQAPLMYSAPELGSDTPFVQTEAAEGGTSGANRRQPSRARTRTGQPRQQEPPQALKASVQGEEASSRRNPARRSRSDDADDVLIVQPRRTAERGLRPGPADVHDRQHLVLAVGEELPVDAGWLRTRSSGRRRGLRPARPG